MYAGWRPPRWCRNLFAAAPVQLRGTDTGGGSIAVFFGRKVPARNDIPNTSNSITTYIT